MGRMMKMSYQETIEQWNDFALLEPTLKEELKSFGSYVKEHTEIKENNENVGFVKFAKDSTANNKINEYMTNWKIISE